MITSHHLLEISWKPSASLENIRKRAEVLKTIRDFFYDRQVLEVETPLIGHTSVTDPFIPSIPVLVQTDANQNTYFLQTSPEYAMKRLLAAKFGSIYQITKAFRQGEIGRFHNPEFTMLEWYRLNFNHHQLMDEMDELLQVVLKTSAAERIAYTDLFQKFLRINPHSDSLETLAQCAQENNITVQDEISDRDTWLQLLMSHVIEPQLGKDQPCFVFDFPITQAALAKIEPGNPPTASRFEVYVQGIELANGFHELQDAEEQRNRFEANVAERKRLGLPDIGIDDFFLGALAYGLPPCAGVAVGIDRLMMIATNATKISDVISFDFSRV